MAGKKEGKTLTNIDFAPDNPGHTYTTTETAHVRETSPTFFSAVTHLSLSLSVFLDSYPSVIAPWLRFPIPGPAAVSFTWRRTTSSSSRPSCTARRSSCRSSWPDITWTSIKIPARSCPNSSDSIAIRFVDDHGIEFFAWRFASPFDPQLSGSDACAFLCVRCKETARHSDCIDIGAGPWRAYRCICEIPRFFYRER